MTSSAMLSCPSMARQAAVQTAVTPRASIHSTDRLSQRRDEATQRREGRSTSDERRCNGIGKESYTSGGQARQRRANIGREPRSHMVFAAHTPSEHQEMVKIIGS